MTEGFAQLQLQLMESALSQLQRIEQLKFGIWTKEKRKQQ